MAIDGEELVSYSQLSDFHRDSIVFEFLAPLPLDQILTTPIHFGFLRHILTGGEKPQIYQCQVKGKLDNVRNQGQITDHLLQFIY